MDITEDAIRARLEQTRKLRDRWRGCEGYKRTLDIDIFALTLAAEKVADIVPKEYKPDSADVEFDKDTHQLADFLLSKVVELENRGGYVQRALCLMMARITAENADDEAILISSIDFLVKHLKDFAVAAYKDRHKIVDQ